MSLYPNMPPLRHYPRSHDVITIEIHDESAGPACHQVLRLTRSPELRFADVYGLSSASSKLTYVDEEGDCVTVTCDAELREAVTNNHVKSLRLTVKGNDNNGIVSESDSIIQNRPAVASTPMKTRPSPSPPASCPCSPCICSPCSCSPNVDTATKSTKDDFGMKERSNTDTTDHHSRRFHQAQDTCSVLHRLLPIFFFLNIISGGMFFVPMVMISIAMMNQQRWRLCQQNADHCASENVERGPSCCPLVFGVPAMAAFFLFSPCIPFLFFLPLLFVGLKLAKLTICFIVRALRAASGEITRKWRANREACRERVRRHHQDYLQRRLRNILSSKQKLRSCSRQPVLDTGVSAPFSANNLQQEQNAQSPNNVRASVVVPQAKNIYAVQLAQLHYMGFPEHQAALHTALLDHCNGDINAVASLLVQ